MWKRQIHIWAGVLQIKLCRNKKLQQNTSTMVHIAAAVK
jgi:hypothetical protein